MKHWGSGAVCRPLTKVGLDPKELSLIPEEQHSEEGDKETAEEASVKSKRMDIAEFRKTKTPVF